MITHKKTERMQMPCRKAPLSYICQLLYKLIYQLLFKNFFNDADHFQAIRLCANLTKPMLFFLRKIHIYLTSSMLYIYYTFKLILYIITTCSRTSSSNSPLTSIKLCDICIIFLCNIEYHIIREDNT